MKVLLVSLNAKYIHTNLAIRYLEAYCREKGDIKLKKQEFTINDHIEGILGEIYKEKADVVAFSCYIWNMEETIKVIQLLKRVQPNVHIILGGPEVSFYGRSWMDKVQEIDCIIKGEGEVTFSELLDSLYREGKNMEDIDGIIYRKENEIIENKDRCLIEDLNTIPFPYEEDLSIYENKIIYYESSRGCPFQCQYCLSSTIHGVRFFPIERVKKELMFFVGTGIKQVKFVDRTFNCDKQRTKELLEFLIQLGGNTNFHFEVAADLIDDEILNILKGAPVGLFQLEIGIQSTHLPTLNAIQRKNDFSQISKVVKTIQSFKNIHQHLDLIAGLPYENYNRFKKSFNDVFSLKGDMLQMGFLKLLKGSGIEVNREKYGYQFTPFPPYEVLSNNDISYDEILQLKCVEDLLERYSNSHVFDFSMDYIISNYYQQPFDFFEEFSAYWQEKGLFKQSHSQKNLYKIFLDFWRRKDKDFVLIHEILKFDYLINHRAPLPKFFKKHTIENKKEMSFEFLKKEKNVEKYLPEYVGKAPKEIYKHIHFEKFNVNILDILGIEKNTLEREDILLLFYFPHKQKEIFKRATFYPIQL